MDRLTSMAVFVKVVDCGGFSAAARRLNMSTTMVSNHVLALEEHLGARLLNRTTRSVGLTETGKAYYERCTGILAEIDDADRSAGALHSTPIGTLRLYMNAQIVRFIAPVVSEYLALHPAASVELTSGERMVDLVEEGYDLAIRAHPPVESTLIVRRLSAWRHILCAAPGYLETHPPLERLEDIARHNCVQYAHYPFGNEWRFVAPDGKPVSVRVSGNLVSNAGEALRLMARDGQALFLAPSFLVYDDIESGRLVELLPGWRPVEFALSALYPHRHQLSSKIRTFIDLAAGHFARHRKWLDLAG